MMKRNSLWISVAALLVAAFVAVSALQAESVRSQDEPSAQGNVVAQTACVSCCAPEYSIVYRKHHVRRKVCCGCCVGTYTAMLQIKDPCSCCPVEVPVCVPACCTEPPSVSCRNGLLGRTITDFTWCCGHSVRIVLTRTNTIIVHTYGS